jgi:hypothetical protein
MSLDFFKKLYFDHRFVHFVLSTADDTGMSSVLTIGIVGWAMPTFCNNTFRSRNDDQIQNLRLTSCIHLHPYCWAIIATQMAIFAHPPKW